MKKNIAVKFQNISKVYKLYNKPIDRLKESIHPFKKKYHKDFYALRDINLEIKKGEVLGIVGVNGAGKSTLLKIIAGVLTPTTGRVQIHGRVNAILELGSSLKPEMTGVENIRLNLQINGIEQDKEKITKDIIEFADIGEYIEQPIKTYSSGMQARLGFGIATSTDPDVLIVDEVLAVGDVLFQRKCYGRIEKLFKDGKTVIFVSHSAQSVIQFCSRAILLYDRGIILDGTPKKVTDIYQRLVFSKKHSDILDEIRGNGGKKIKEMTNYGAVDVAHYLPDLISKPQVENNFNVDIFDVKILNSAGKKVNILETGESYVYAYKVKFLDSYKDVSFGMHVKTLKGLALTSSAMHNKEETVSHVNKNEVYTIKWNFVCNLLGNIYLSNAGVFINNGSILSRVVDAYVFKVESQDFFKVGYLNLNQDVSFEKENI